MTGDLPILFLDVDGVLIPLGGDEPKVFRSRSGQQPGHPLASRIDPALGTLLERLPYEIRWSTTWADDANDVICPWLGLRPFPVVRWLGEDAPLGVHWKCRA